MKKILIIIGVIVVVGAGWLIISRTGQRQSSSTTSNTTTQASPTAQSLPDQQAGDKAPDFHLQNYSGKTINPSDFAGKPLVINSWAAWCPFCRQEIPDFATAQKEFGDKIVIIAIDRAESLAVAKGYTDQQGTTNNLIFLLDPSDSFYQSIGGFSMPETIFVDKNGNVVDHKRGPMDIKEIRERMQKILVSTSVSHNETPQIENVVTYGDVGFSPSVLRVKVGATVTFKNGESETMWVASNPHPIHTDYSGFDAKRGYAKGESYSFTFAKSGTWKYHNHLNPSEGGTIVVE